MFKYYAKHLLGRLLFMSRVQRVLLGDRAIIVAFHSVNEDAVESDINCTPALFEHYCRFFKTYFDVISLSELLSRLDSGKDVSSCLVITFDDGYKDNYTIAAPILKSMNLPATFFVTTGFINSNRVAPWDAELEIESKWMDWDDVAALDKQGFDIGGHTVNHPSLAHLSDDEAAQEIRQCKAELETRLQKSIPHFAYPFGGPDNMSDSKVVQVEGAGFACCMSCHGGAVNRGDNVYKLRRAPITTRHLSPYDFGFDCVREAGHSVGTH